MTNNAAFIAIHFHHYYMPFLPPSCRCWTLCESTCARRCSGSGGSQMWTVCTCTASLIASSPGCSGVTARACGAVSPTTGRPEQSYTVAELKLMTQVQCKKDVFTTTKFFKAAQASIAVQLPALLSHPPIPLLQPIHSIAWGAEPQLSIYQFQWQRGQFLLSFNTTRNTVSSEWHRQSDRPSRPRYTLLKALRNERNIRE